MSLLFKKGISYLFEREVNQCESRWTSSVYSVLTQAPCLASLSQDSMRGRFTSIIAQAGGEVNSAWLALILESISKIVWAGRKQA
jgi:hypothetical protein